MGRATARVGRCSARRSPCSAPGGSPDPEIPPDAFSAVLFYAGLPSRWTGNSKGRAKHAIASEVRSEEHTSELQSLMRISYAVFCLKKKKPEKIKTHNTDNNLTIIKQRSNNTHTNHIIMKHETVSHHDTVQQT